MDGAHPNENVRRTPRPNSYPPNFSPSPSPSTPHFPSKTSLIVKTSSGSLILQDYRKIHYQQQSLGRLEAVFRQSLQNKASHPDFHQPQPPNLQPPPLRSPLPLVTVLQAPVHLLPLSQHSQDQTGHWKKEIAPTQHCPAAIAISDAHFHDPPLLRPDSACRSPPKAVSYHTSESTG